jgi:hypothetical protein
MAGVEFKASISGVIHMERVVRRLHAADEGSVMDTAEKIKRDTVAHLYRVWKKQSGAAGDSVQIRGSGKSKSSPLRATLGHGLQGYVTSGGASVQVGSFYEDGDFQRGINHFVLLEGGFTLRDGRTFRPGGHSLAFASQLHAGNLPASWQRIWASGAREFLVRGSDE